MTKRRWLVASDLHGSVHLYYSLYQELLSNDLISAVILCGDLTDGGKWSDAADSRIRAEFSLAQSYIKKMAAIRPVYWIPGNHDMDIEATDFSFENVVNIDRRTVLIEGLSVHGVNQSPCFDFPEFAREWRNMSVLPEVDQAAFTFEAVDIVVSHCPPLGILDGVGIHHAGSPALNDYVRIYQPKFVFCGHAHEQRGRIVRAGSTTIANLANTRAVFSV